MVVLDEAQDCSPAFLDAFMQLCASCPKIMAYDLHQSIYSSSQGSAAAIESIKATHHFRLSTTFRFGRHVASLATKFIMHYLGRADFAIQPAEGQSTVLTMSASEAAMVDQVLAVGKMLVVLAPTHVALLRYAYDVLAHSEVGFGMVRFAAGDAFCFVHETNGAYAMRQLLSYKGGGLVEHPVLRRFIDAGFAFADFATHVAKHSRHVDGDTTNWVSALSVLKEMGSKAGSMIDRLACCGGCASFGGPAFLFSTIHASKGLEYEWVYVVDDGLLPPWNNNVHLAADAFMRRDGRVPASTLLQDLRLLVVDGCNGDEERAVQKLHLVYVAMSRARERLVLSAKVAIWLRPLGLNLFSEETRRRKKPRLDAVGAR